MLREDGRCAVVAAIRPGLVAPLSERHREAVVQLDTRLLVAFAPAWHHSVAERITPMKMNIEIDCSPTEARAFLGLPDVTAVNAGFTDAVATAMKGGASPERMQEMAKAFAPMSELGMAMFNQFVKAAKTPE